MCKKTMISLASLIPVILMLGNCMNEGGAQSISKKDLYFKHVDALCQGNRELLKHFGARTLTYHIIHENKKIGELVNRIMGTGQMYQLLTVDDLVIEKMLKDKEGTYRDAEGERSLKRGEIDDMRLVAAFSDFTGYFRMRRPFEIVGTRTINKIPCYQVEIRNLFDERIADIFLSQENFHVVKRISGLAHVTYSDYRVVDGVSFAHELKAGGEEGTFHCVLVSLEIESNPSEATASLPSRLPDKEGVK